MTYPGSHVEQTRREINHGRQVSMWLIAGCAAFGLVGIILDNLGAAVVGTAVAAILPVAIEVEARQRLMRAYERDEAERLERERQRRGIP